MGILTKIGCFIIGWKSDILKECGEASHRTFKRYISAIIILSIIGVLLVFALRTDMLVSKAYMVRYSYRLCLRLS